MTEVEQSVLLFGHRLAGAERTGVGRYAADLVGGLAARPAGDGLRYRTATLREPPPIWLPDGTTHVGVPGPRRPLALAWSTIGRPRIERLVPEVDLVHTLLAWVPVPTRRPLVVTLFDLMALREPAWYPAAERWRYARAWAQAADRADAVVVLSRFVGDDVTARLGIEPDRIQVVAPGVPAPFLTPPSADAMAAVTARYGLAPSSYVLTLGAVSPRKNLSVVARAIAALPPDPVGAVELVAIGPDGVGADQVRSELADLGLGRRVRLLGFVPDDDIAALVAAASALAHPSRDEGFGYPPLEAMAVGTPVVASSAGSLPEVVGDGGTLLDPDDVGAWAAALDDIRRAGPDDRAAQAERGRRQAARFSWDRAAADLVALHRRLLDRP
jgi:alpha-1,3-rhamnosyl/mannosyltransferase